MSVCNVHGNDADTFSGSWNRREETLHMIWARGHPVRETNYKNSNSMKRIKRVIGESRNWVGVGFFFCLFGYDSFYGSCFV